MARKFNARRYAQAVLEIALEKKDFERWQNDLEKVAEVISDGIFLAVLESPKVKFEDKSRLLKASLADIGPLALNLVMMLVARGHINMVPEIATEYHRLVDEYRGIESADIVTAVPLDKADEEHLAQQLGGMTGKKVQVKSSVDPAIIGGIVARVGGKLLDGSTRSKLLALKKELAGGSGVGG
jgi:F-type H+-transporting ATPase subunit delta